MVVAFSVYGKVLLGKRKCQPEYGKWDLPVGSMGLLVDLLQITNRILRRNANVHITADGALLLCKRDFTVAGEIHNIVCVQGVVEAGRRPIADGDFLDVRFFAKEEVPWPHVFSTATEILSEVGWTKPVPK